MNCGCHSHNGFLTVRGYAENAQRGDDDRTVPKVLLTGREKISILDRYVSVSASTGLELHWDDDVIEEQHRRFINGS